MTPVGQVTVKMPSISTILLLGLLVYGTNAAHTPSPKQLGDITVLARNNLRSKHIHTPYCLVLRPATIGENELGSKSPADSVHSK